MEHQSKDMKGLLVLRVIKFKGLFITKTITISITITIALNMRIEKVHTKKNNMVGITFIFFFPLKLKDNKNIDQLESKCSSM